MSDGPYDFLADFDRDELACLGMRRASDNWLADLDREALLDCFKPRADPAPAKPRPRKPSLAHLVAKAKKLGVDVTIAPDGTATFRTGSSTPETNEWDEVLPRHGTH